jgi:hypothetical protein
MLPGATMKAGDRVSLDRMKAWWTWGEMRSPRWAAGYRADARAAPLCARVESLAFEQLAAGDIAALAEVFEEFRGEFLAHYWAEVREFVIEEWSADRLGRIYAMTEADPLGGGHYRPLAVYAAAARPTGAGARLDPRVAADAVPPGLALRASAPLIVGLYKGFQVLIDGHFRGILFLRSARPGERIATLAPVAL